MTIKNGDVITFYTHASPDNMWADNLQVRMSTNGASTNVGTGSAAVGDFTTLLLEINPTLALGVYPYLNWQQYTITISGLSAPTSGRFAFRYYVTDGGPSGTNSDYIGIDNFVYTPYVCPTLTVTPSSLPNGTAGASYNQTLSQTNGLGSVTYSVTAGALPPGTTLSTGGVLSGTPTATGTYNFTVTVTDASGCIGSTAYTLVIDCPTNGASLAAFPALCDNDSPYIMSEGSPSGGTYSGTGVTGSSFDPLSGTQLITYSLVDIYACPQSASATITVNTAPTVTLASFNQVCEDDAVFALTGGSPLGGTYSGTGVSGGNFDPANSGTFTITYDYTDGNGCSNAATADISVVSCLGTGELFNEFNFKAYPNPTDGMFTIKFDLP
ncbi:MAG: putative Ig domain-containing protein, partial [Crocinitomicaceae bacterium]|nr:putative Ig domain-containing protein [Crocinitomicaceae bacterium]